MKILSSNYLIEADVPPTSLGDTQKQAQTALDWTNKDVKNLKSSYATLRRLGLNTQKVTFMNTAKFASFSFINNQTSEQSNQIFGTFALAYENDGAYFFPYVSQNVPTLKKSILEQYFYIKLFRPISGQSQFDLINIKDVFDNFNRSDTTHNSFFYSLKIGNLFDSINKNNKYIGLLPKNISELRSYELDQPNSDYYINFRDVNTANINIESSYENKKTGLQMKYSLILTFTGGNNPNNDRILKLFNSLFTDSQGNKTQQIFYVTKSIDYTHSNYHNLTILRPYRGSATIFYKIYTKDELDFTRRNIAIDCIIEDVTNNRYSCKLTIDRANIIP